MLPPFRCDIVAKWAALDIQQISWGSPEPNVEISFADNGEVSLRRGQSSVRLYAINTANEPPIHSLPVEFDGDKIKLSVNAKEITEKAKLLTSSAARIKAEAKRAAKLKAEQAAQAEYERCKAIVTPEAIRRCVKRVKRLRKLASWLRAVSKELDKVPSLPALIVNPLFNAFDREYSEAYGDARLAYIEAKRKRDNFKPRSWRSNGREKHNENVKLALAKVRGIAFNALDHSIRAAGFNAYNGRVSDHSRYSASDVRRCRDYMRDHEKETREC